MGGNQLVGGGQLNSASSYHITLTHKNIKRVRLHTEYLPIDTQLANKNAKITQKRGTQAQIYRGTHTDKQIQAHTDTHIERDDSSQSKS